MPFANVSITLKIAAKKRCQRKNCFGRKKSDFSAKKS
jgi:hypothetical protein